MASNALKKVILHTLDYTPIRTWEWSSSINYSQSDSQYETPAHVSTPTSLSGIKYVINAWANARYIEDSNDPGIRMVLEYRHSSGDWTPFGDTDGVLQARYEDRGSANYIRGTISHTAQLTPQSSTLYSGTINLRQVITGAGGTVTDSLDVYAHGYHITEVRYA